MELTEETDVRFVVEANCRVNADRMVKAIRKECTNIQDISRKGEKSWIIE